MYRETRSESEGNKEDSVLQRAQEILGRAGISDYTHEERPDGLHIRIKTTPEHVADRQRQMARLTGGLEPSQFMRDKTIPLIKLLREQEELRFNFIEVPLEARFSYLELVVSKKQS